MSSVVISSLVAVVISTALIFLKEIYWHRERKQKETKILAIRLKYILENFILEVGVQTSDIIINYIEDNYTMPNGDIEPLFSHTSEEEPNLKVDLADLDWKNLD